MKYTTIHLAENKIELFTSLLGKETVKVNGEIVSEKSSITGTEHVFKIRENDIENTYKLITGSNVNGIGFSLYKNENPIIEMPKSKFVFYFLVIIGIIIGKVIMNAVMNK